MKPPKAELMPPESSRFLRLSPIAPRETGRTWMLKDFPEAAGAIGNAFRQAARSTGVAASADALFAALVPKERKQADALALQGRLYIQRTAKDASPSAVRAAIIRVMQEMEAT